MVRTPCCNAQIFRTILPQNAVNFAALHYALQQLRPFGRVKCQVEFAKSRQARRFFGNLTQNRYIVFPEDGAERFACE